MRIAEIYVNQQFAGLLTEVAKNYYIFEYNEAYQGPPVSLTMPITQKKYEYHQFPPFFDGLLPEGIMLSTLLRQCKLDRDDYLGQLIQVGKDLVGNVEVWEHLSRKNKK